MHYHKDRITPHQTNAMKKSFYYQILCLLLICQQMKADTHPSAPHLHPIPSDSTRPYLKISVDLITDLPLSNGFDSIMVVVDHGLLKGVTLSACNKTITAEGVADLFLERVFTRFG